MNLIEARARKRKTQWDLRKLAGIDQTKISLIENGYVEPSEKEKEAIAKVLGFGVGEIDWPNVEQEEKMSS